ncbi:hypothetical protein EIP86_003696 [Pleurotus ostreatoroseus]|nr:hypothetical protein EIP86_003696 [Pleurotus ostreatoroseus]
MAAPQRIQGDPWFEDGNFVLVTIPQDIEEASIAFKVHRGVLARHSEVFRSMFEVPQSVTGDEILDGCPVVAMPDVPSELSVLIKAIYDGPCFHPKLQVESPSRMPSELTAQDLQDYTLVWQSRIDFINTFIRSCCFEHNPSGCTGTQCTKAFVTMGAQLSKDWRTRTGPLHFILQAIDGLSEYPLICGNCRNVFRQNALFMRESYWESLPGIVGLPSWEVLQEELDPASSRPSSATSPPSSPAFTSSSGGSPLESPTH